jgi:CarD family transcriptional regulator
MQFSVGDRVVHPHHGPGEVKSVERRQFLDEAKRYYVIEIPAQELTLYIPLQNAEQVGIRPIMRQSKLRRVLATLGGSPELLPEDFRERQEEVGEKLKTGHTLTMAEVVRDLTWHGRRAHLTKRDAEYLQWGRDFLAAEMAFASDTEVSEANERMDAALETGMLAAAEEDESQE